MVQLFHSNWDEGLIARPVAGVAASYAASVLGLLDYAGHKAIPQRASFPRASRAKEDGAFVNVLARADLYGRGRLELAKDLPEVRREVFKLLLGHEVNFYAIVRDKAVVTQKVLDHNKTHPNYRYHPNQLYDRCVAQLLKERLHKGDGYSIYFARRGRSDRTEALKKAIEAARSAFRQRWGISGTAPIEIVPSNPQDVVCLQAVDYFLWALQRFYEKDEDRFLNLVWPQTKLVIDFDDTRVKKYGV